MNTIKYHLPTGNLAWDWHLHFLQEDEARLGLLKILDDYQQPRFWDGNQTIPMQLVGSRDLVDDHPSKQVVNGEDFVRIVEPDGTEWAPLLEWNAAGGFGRPITGPPMYNIDLVRIVSPKLREIMLRFRLPDHKFFPVQVTHEVTGEKRNYYLFQLLGNIHSGRVHAYWPAISFRFIQVESKEVFQQFEAGSAKTYDEAVDLYRKAKTSLEPSTNSLRFVHDYLMYTEQYDLVWGDGRMGLTESLAQAIAEEFAEGFVYPWHWQPIYVGFDPSKDFPIPIPTLA